MFKLKNLFLTISLIVVISLVVGWGISMVLAWTDPGANPPSGNVAAPINVSSTAQTKTGTLGADGGFQVDNNWVIDSDAGWHRTYGNTGWYNGTYGGGWYMIDDTWIRAYNNKNVITGGSIRADKGAYFEGDVELRGTAAQPTARLIIAPPVGYTGGTMIITTGTIRGGATTVPGSASLILDGKTAINRGLYVTSATAGYACTGVPTPCETFTKESDCDKQTGCIWDSGLKICEGSPDPCSTFPDQTSCISGCTWEMTYATAANFDGKVGIQRDDPGTYALYVAGNAYATGGWSGSDIRWKKDIEPINNALNKILNLRGVSFDWNIEDYPDQEFSNGKQIGLIAQEVEKILPELVLTNTDGYKAVSYERLVPVLVEAIKELKNEIDSLKQEIRSLKEF